MSNLLILSIPSIIESLLPSLANMLSILNVANENPGGDDGPGLGSIPALISSILFIKEKMCSHIRKHNGLKRYANTNRFIRAGRWQENESLIGSVSKMLGEMSIEKNIFISVNAKYEIKESRKVDILDFENRKDFPLKAPIAALYKDKLMSINPCKPNLERSH